MYVCAASGMSRNGIAAQIGLSKGATIGEWLARGLAKPDDEPYGEFALKFRQAERLHESMCVDIQSAHLRQIQRKPAYQRTQAEIEWVSRHLARRYPKEHGSGEGLAPMRELTPEVDLDAWWLSQGLDREQMQALVREPPESLAEALVAEGDAVFALLCARGWAPPKG